jgi:hypothetical protein
MYRQNAARHALIACMTGSPAWSRAVLRGGGAGLREVHARNIGGIWRLLAWQMATGLARQVVRVSLWDLSLWDLSPVPTQNSSQYGELGIMSVRETVAALCGMLAGPFGGATVGRWAVGRQASRSCSSDSCIWSSARSPAGCLWLVAMRAMTQMYLLPDVRVSHQAAARPAAAHVLAHAQRVVDDNDPGPGPLAWWCR